MVTTTEMIPKVCNMDMSKHQLKVPQVVDIIQTLNERIFNILMNIQK